MNKIVKLLILILLTSNVQAQTARWAIAPEYDSVERYSDGLFKVGLGDSFGVIDKEGHEIIPAIYDSVSNFTEGIGLVTNKTKNGNHLVGLISKDGRFITINQEWYVKEYPFFSEGKLPVCNAQGWYGFINTSGKLVLDFKYARIHPFSDGYAAVCKTKLTVPMMKPKVMYINEEGEQLILQSDIGNIYFATTFKYGEALVIPKSGDHIIINTSGNMVRIDNNVVMQFDEKNALMDIKPLKSKETGIVYDGPTTFLEGNKYGYKTDKALMLPSQFDKADPFSKGYAIASVSGKKGLLKLLPENFAIEVVSGTIQSDDPDIESVEYHIRTPKEWQNQSLTLRCEVNGKASTFTAPANNSEIRVFSFMLEKGKRSLILAGDRIVLLSTNGEDIHAASEASYKDAVKIRVSPSKVKANEKDQASVSVTVTNESDKDLSIMLGISGDSIRSTVKELTLAPGEKSKPIYVSITTKGLKRTEKKNIAVKVTINESSETFSIRRQIEVEPFFNEY